MRFKAILLLLLAVFMLSACESGFTKEQLVQANSNLDTYSADIEMEYIMDSESIMTMEIRGQIDRVNEKASMSMGMDMGGLMAMLGSESITYDVYIIGNTMYMGMMDEWMKIDLDQTLPDGSAMPADFWGEQDQIEKELELLADSEIEMLESEVVGVTQYYVVNVVPDRESLLNLVSENMGALGGTDSESAELLESMDDYSVKLWVNQNSLIIERGEHRMSFSIDDEWSNETMTMDIITSYSIDDINEPVNIELPEEAKNAQDIYDMQNNMADGVTVDYNMT